ncbi:MAG: glycoside-pentoside-hexuronide (GPH):cation symporter [Candidatus Izemoplasmatales bacterium]
MGSDVLTVEKKLLRRNKWNYSLGGIGRDMIYQLVATFLMTYIQFSGLGLTKEQFSVIGVMLVIGRIWDAVNDPFMGSIVENTHTRWGKFRPWILIGGVLTSIVILVMFNFRPSGWGFVVFFAIIYLLWEAAFTLNDIPYWSLIPALSRNKKDRDVITTMVVVFAGVGAFIANAFVAFTTVGNAVAGYRTASILFVVIFLACTCLTVFGVKEPREAEADVQAEKVGLKQMFSIIFKNDQLLWASLALVLYTVGSNLLVTLGYNFFYLEIRYDGSLTMAFIVTFAVSTFSIQGFYAALARRFSRRRLLTYSLIATVFGYGMLLLLGWTDILPINVWLVCAFGAFVFAGQAIFYMVLIVNMTNTIEYNQHKTGKRNEAVIFALRPFVAKFGSAIEQVVFVVILLASGVYVMSQNVSALENLKNTFDNLTAVERVAFIDNANDGVAILDNIDIEDAEKAAIYAAIADPTNEVFTYDAEAAIWTMSINAAADSVFHDLASANLRARLVLRLAITILPAALIGGSYVVLRKKYIIDEKYYEEITAKNAA